MKHKKLLEIKNNLKINNGRDFWKSLILENLINIYEQGDNENFKIENITEENIENMIDYILSDDNLWQEIDYSIAAALENEIY